MSMTTETDSASFVRNYENMMDVGRNAVKVGQYRTETDSLLNDMF